MSAFTLQQALIGNGFIGTAPVAGVTIPVAGGTAQTFALWNPSGSNRRLVLDKLTLGAINATTPTLGTWVIGAVLNAGSAIGAAGAPITAFTATLPTNMLVGGGNAPTGRFSVAATTIAVTTIMALPFSRETVTATVGPIVQTYDFDGSLVVMPNTLICLGNTTVQTEAWMPTLSWVEVGL